ncbi:PREDICTED: neurexin-1 isoform X2 [Bactrocera latifrons]|uniref:neurexin-1 isoform X2 n=1 Tax=Bactrocera latifrons TaxID=174628 RepID=UPI0008DE81E9|nr:PREDICTED: neurexin-1 isoform X2 [Bactrocera latifrons]
MSLGELCELLPGSTMRRINNNFSAFAMTAVSYLSNGTITCHGSSSGGSGCCISGRLINRHSNDYSSCCNNNNSSRQQLQTIQQKLPLRQTLRQQRNNGNINANYKFRNSIKAKTTTTSTITTSTSSAVPQLVGCPEAGDDVPSYSPYSSCGRLKQRRKLRTLLPTNVTASAYALTGLVLLCSVLLSPCHAFQLDGSQNSFAQFRKWYTGLNGSLELEFKTEQPNGLVLYTDDGGTYDFFELKLVEGALRLRYNLGGGAHIVTVGRELHDGHWHKVQVLRNDEQTSLIVDGVSQSSTTKGKEFQFGKFATNSDVYVGGMPNWYSTKLALLALPSVIFEPRFRGAIRNLVYADQPGGATRRQEMKQPRDIKCGDGPCDNGEMPKEKVPRGVRGGNTTDACERSDPCQHGGICISTDSGPICECRNLEYDGQYCEKEKAPSEATFRGQQFLSYDLGQTSAEPIVSAQDAITLYFRTRQPNGLLFYTGHGTDYLNLALRDGGVSLTMGLANGKQEMHIKPSKVRFDDHQWHKVTVHRRIQEISSITSFCRLVTVVDDVYTDHSHIAGKFTMLSSSRVYVGGAVNPRALLGARVHNNFVGCLRKVEFSADTLLLNLIDLAKSGSKLIQVAGNVEYQCPIGDPQDPVTFTTRESHLILPPWETGKQSSISFKFRTKEPNGLIILATGSKQPRSKNAVLFAIELLNGHIYIHLDLGSGAAKVRASRRRVDDGDWHDLILRRNGRDAKVSVDGVWNEFRTPGDGTILELDGHMYVGGTGPAYNNIAWPPAIWTATLRQGFVGCLRDLVLSGKAIDIAAFARLQDSASVKPSCHVQANVCSGNPCLNGGTCIEGWNRPICDCTATLYAGPTCGRELATLAFNGSQHMTVWLGNGQGTKTQTEELIIRFKTSRPTGLILLTSAESNSPDRLEIALVAGRVRASVRLSDREKNLLAGQSVLNDNNWHTIRFSRRASNLRLQVDGVPPVRAETILGRHSTIEIRSIHLGGMFHAEEEIQMTSTMPNFIGQLQGFIFNGQRYIDIVKNLGPELSALPSATFKLTARFVNSPPGNPYHAATFRSKHSYVGLPMLKAYSSVSVDFRFKTVEPNGLLLYNGGRRNDFIALELVNGHIHYTFDIGDGPITMRDKSRIHMNDNRWHQVSIRRPGPKTHTLTVDDSFEIVTLTGNSMHLELSGILYIGGVFKDMYAKLPASISSRSGFEGCLASLDLGDTSPTLTSDAVVPSSLVVTGCEGPTKCSQNACANRGVCVQQWNAYVCECDMTSYTGPTCYDESIAYEFGNNKGIIQYAFPENMQADTEEDNVALGFITTKSDAVILRMESATTQDYMELEIVEGNIFMVYNIGTRDLPLGEIGTKVNDNTYHVVRFSRKGGNATLQLDDYNVQTLTPQGHQSTVFNTMSSIQVGGKFSRGGRTRIERPFAGVIAGLSVNKLRILDLAVERDPHITIRGDVQLVTGVLDRNDLQRMQQTPASGYPGAIDDLIFSGAGSGCRGDDEDECTPPFESGSGDDLITPVYVPPTKQTTTAQVANTDKTNGTERACDDEDCLHGSGDYGETTEQFTSTSTAKGSEPNHEIISSTTDGVNRRLDTSSTTTEQQRSTTTLSSSVMTRTESQTYAPRETTVPYSATTSIVTQQRQTSTPTSIYTTSTQRAFTSTLTTTTSQATPPPEIHSTATEHQTTPYDIIQVFSGGEGGERHHGDEDEKSNMIFNGEHTSLPEERPPPHIPSPHETPPYFQMPPQQPPTYGNNYRSKGKGGRVNSIEEERTAMIIGIVAGILIAVILVILLVLWLKSTGDRNYKTEGEKAAAYGHNPNAALLGNSSTNGSYHQQRHHGTHHQSNGHNASGGGGGSGTGGSGSGSMLGAAGVNSGGVVGYGCISSGIASTGADGRPQMAGLVQPKPKKRDSKDVKEWYV